MYELGELLLAIATSASFHTCAYVRQAGFLLVDSRVLRPAALHASVSIASFCAPRYSRFAAVTWFPTCIYRGSSFLLAFPLAVNEPVSLGSPIRAPPPRFPWPPDLRRVNALSFMPAAVASSLPLTHPWKALPPAVAVTATWLAVRAESEEALAAVGAADGWPPRPAAPAPLR